jgi:hypothetical protein
MFCKRFFKEKIIYGNDKSIKEYNKEYNKDMLNCIKLKKVRFNNMINVALIPCRDEYYQYSMDKLLWWKNEDYNDFKKNFFIELNI